WHVTNAVVTKNDGLMNQRMQIFVDRAKGIFLRRLTLGPAKMRHQNDFRAMVAKVIDGRQAFPDSGVIGDANLAAANFSRHVEIDAHQHAFSADIEITDRKLHSSIENEREQEHEHDYDWVNPPAVPSTPRSDCCSPIRYHTSRPPLRSGCPSSASACYRRCRSGDCRRCPRKR